MKGHISKKWWQFWKSSPIGLLVEENEVQSKNEKEVRLITDEIIDLLKKFNLINNSTNSIDDYDEEDWDGDYVTIIKVIFGELLEDYSVDYASDIGIWKEGVLVGEYATTVLQFISASKGSIKIENFKTVNPVNEAAEYGIEDEDAYMTVSFDHNRRSYSWKFRMYGSDEYFHEVTQWAHEALDENVLFIGEENFSAYCIPKELIA